MLAARPGAGGRGSRAVAVPLMASTAWSGIVEHTVDRANELFRYLLARVPCSVFCDIGSRDAGTALEMSDLAPRARFICFEAERDNYEAILKNPSIDAERFRIEHLAVTDRNGPVRFNVYRNPHDPQNRGLGSLKVRHELDPVSVEDVQGVTLDDYLGSRYPGNGDLVLWIDVEGAALQVLQGAVQSLARTNLVFVEVEEAEIFEETHARREVIEFLDDNGFREVLYRPYKGNTFGDALFVSKSVYDRLGLGRAIGWFALRFPLLAGWQGSKQIAFKWLSRVPFFLRGWRLIKPDGARRP